MKRWMKCILASLLVVHMGCTASEQSYKTMTMAEAQEVFAEDGDYVIVDVRREEEYAQGHIQGAICIPNESIENTPLEQLPDLNQTIYVYCRSGNRSKQASEKLAAIGYTNVIECGGINDYQGEMEEGSQKASETDEEMKDVLVGTWKSEDGTYVIEITKDAMYKGVFSKDDKKLYESTFTLQYLESTEDAVAVYEFDGFSGDMLNADCNNFNAVKSVILTQEDGTYQLFMHLLFNDQAETVYLYAE